MYEYCADDERLFFILYCEAKQYKNIMLMICARRDSLIYLKYIFLLLKPITYFYKE